MYLSLLADITVNGQFWGHIIIVQMGWKLRRTQL